MLSKLLLATNVLLVASSAYGQASIVDSQPMAGSPSTTNARGSFQERDRSRATVQTELYMQLQMLQDEVQQLRGLVEQQTYELKQLKQQRLDDYLDLDRRIGKQSDSTVQVLEPTTTAFSGTQSKKISDGSTFKKGEFASYQAAIGFAIKKRDFDSAVSALNTHLEQYPQGNYVANAQFWLGQIYSQKGEFALSKQWFSRMLEQSPNHRKAAEAKFKLAKVLNSLGESKQSKALLQEVAGEGSSVSDLASDYLKQNF